MTTTDWVEGYVYGLEVAQKAIARTREQVSGNCECLFLVQAWIADLKNVTRTIFKNTGNPGEKSPEDMESHVPLTADSAVEDALGE